jgi:hypothetical protein
MEKVAVNPEELSAKDRTIWEYEKDMEMSDLAGYPLPEILGTAYVCK